MSDTVVAAQRKPRLMFSMVALILVAAAAATWMLNREDPCANGAVLHPPAGSCINPRALVVSGTVEDVTEAISEIEGTILYSVGTDRFVRVPADDLDDLDRAKAALEASGIKVRYAFVVQLD